MIDLAQALAEKNKRLAPNNLICFANYILPYYTASWHHIEIARHLEAVERGEIKRLMIFMPPRHGKSELASKLFPAWYIGRNPSNNIMVASYSSTLASHFGYEVRGIVSEEKYKALFNTRLKQDSKAKSLWKTEQGGAYLSDGVGGGFTGRGADVFFIDDPIKNREEADSSTIQDKIYRWYTSAVATRLSSNGAVVIVQTRWSDKDLSAVLLYDNPDKWTVLSFPAIATENEQHRKIGEALWPSRFPKEHLMEIKKEVKEDWEPLYQQDPIGLDNGTFKKEWIKRYETLPTSLKVRIIIDLASSEDKRAAENAILVIGQAEDRKRYILDSWGDMLDEGRRYTPDELVEKAYEFFDKWSPQYGQIRVYPESVGYQSTLKYNFKHAATRRSREGKKTVILEELKTPTTRSKNDKIEALAGPMSHAMVYFPHGGTEELEKQILRFPKGNRVDRLDTLAMDLDIERRPQRKVVVPRPVYDKKTGRLVNHR